MPEQPGEVRWMIFLKRVGIKSLALNLKSPFFLMQKFLSLLEKAGDKNDPSRIINVGSVDGITNSIFENISYSASKAALHHMTKVAATKLALGI